MAMNFMIEGNIKKKVKNTSSIKIKDFKVDVNKGICTLEGQVSKKWMAAHIETLAKEEKDVDTVINNIQYPEEAGGDTGAAKPETKETTYRVERGDTLSKIAQKVYGDGNLYNIIFEANKDILANTNDIHPGQVLKIPPKPEITEKTKGIRTYTIKKGDTLGAIAKNYYGDWKKYTIIFEANRDILDDPNKIYPGQVLKIPEL